MAENRINLNNYKASGVYTIEVDQSQNVALPLTTGRLVVGSSRVGPFNTVVLINDLKTLKAVYGDIDPKLEKAGSYFHRMIEVALKEGPVYALNVVPLDMQEDTLANQDQAWFTTFNTESASNNTILPESYPVNEFFNRRGLWVASEDEFNKVKNLALGDDYISNPGSFGQATIESNKILSFDNLGNSNATVWVRKADVKGFDVTAKEWFTTLGGGNAIEFPNFLHEDDFISDYFVEAIVINGDWSNYLKLSKDPVYKQFFTESGLKTSKTADFFALREVKVLSRVVGSLIPNFKDQAGVTVSIDDLFNRQFPVTGLMCALDANKLDLVDLTSTSFIDQDVETHRIDLVGHGYDDLNQLDAYSADNGGRDTDDSVADFTPLIDVLSYKKPADKDLIFLITNNPSNSVALAESDFLNGYNNSPGTVSVAKGDIYLVDATDSYIAAMEGSALYNSYFNGFIKNGDNIKDGSNTYYIKVVDNLTTGTPAIPYIRVEAYADNTLINQVDLSAGNGYYNSTTDLEDYFKVSMLDGSEFKKVFDLTDSNYFTYFTVEQPNKLIIGVNQSNKTVIDEFIKVNNYIKAKIYDGSRSRLLKIIKVQSKETLGSPIGLEYTITTMSPQNENIVGLDVSNNELHVYKGIYNFVTSLKGQYLKSFKLRDSSLPNSTPERQSDILKFLFDYTAIPKALANGELIDFRYVVDTYEGEISSSSKYWLVKLAATNGKAMAFVNTPSIQQFERSVTPSFIDRSTRMVSTELISTGGDLSLNPDFTFAFAEEDVNGIPLSSYAHYCFPNLIIKSGSKDISVPAATYVSNLYVRKFKAGTPFLIVAGGKRGAINDSEVQGLEYDLSDDDRALLEPLGHNLIVKRRGFGTLLFSNNTAYQRINSALNNAHVRDNLSTIERDINRILFNFLFDFNDEITRIRIKTIVENYLDSVVNAKGLALYEVTFDSSNNGEDVLSANSAIIDIKVDFPRGIQKFINRITITRVGGSLSSETTGFIPSF